MVRRTENRVELDIFGQGDNALTLLINEFCLAAPTPPADNVDYESLLSGLWRFTDQVRDGSDCIRDLQTMLWSCAYCFRTGKPASWRNGRNTGVEFSASGKSAVVVVSIGSEVRTIPFDIQLWVAQYRDIIAPTVISLVGEM